MGFSRQEYWSGLPFPPLGDLPNPGIKPASLLSPALAGIFFTTRATWEAPSSVTHTHTRTHTHTHTYMCICKTMMLLMPLNHLFFRSTLYHSLNQSNSSLWSLDLGRTHSFINSATIWMQVRCCILKQKDKGEIPDLRRKWFLAGVLIIQC